MTEITADSAIEPRNVSGNHWEQLEGRKGQGGGHLLDRGHASLVLAEGGLPPGLVEVRGLPSRSESGWLRDQTLKNADLSPTVKTEFCEFSCMRAFCL